jgi:hypothetical protein
MRAFVAIAAVIGLLATQLAADEPKKDDGISPAMKPYAEKLLELAKTYERLGRIDDELRWAPGLCRMPQPGRPQFSDSKDDDTHGRKLYSLFAKDQQKYFETNNVRKDVVTAPIGQIIVKESWVPEETKLAQTPAPIVKKTNPDAKPPLNHVDHFLPYVQKDGKWYKASKLAGLYVMMKFDPKTPDTDQGWIYGTVSADLKRVTAVGKIASCMECHTKTKHDRQFGIRVVVSGGE